MSGFWTLLRLDAKLAVRHKLVHVTVAVALLFGLLVGFALPEQLDPLDHASHDRVRDATVDQRFAPLTLALGSEAVFDDDASLRAAVIDDPASLGITFTGTPTAPAATVYVQGNESPARRALIETGVDAMWRHVATPGVPEPARPTVLDPGAHKPPFNQLFVPILFALDLCLLGFMFASVMLLQDKQHETVRMFRVSPGTTGAYVGSKLTINLGLSLLNMLILTGLGAPGALTDPRLFLLVLGTCAGMTLLGLGLAVWFRNLAQLFFPLAAIGLTLAMPSYLLFTPTAALAWTWWLPTYHLLFGAEAIMFAGDPGVILAAAGYCAVFVAVTAIFCVTNVHYRLLREVH